MMGGGWISVKDKLPPVDVPVWIYDPEIGGPIIGGRSDGGEGWLWCECYGQHWYDGWQASDFEQDDITPTHWMPLPDPPDESD